MWLDPAVLLAGCALLIGTVPLSSEPQWLLGWLAAGVVAFGARWLRSAPAPRWVLYVWAGCAIVVAAMSTLGDWFVNQMG